MTIFEAFLSPLMNTNVWERMAQGQGPQQQPGTPERGNGGNAASANRNRPPTGSGGHAHPQPQPHPQQQGRYNAARGEPTAGGMRFFPVPDFIPMMFGGDGFDPGAFFSAAAAAAADGFVPPPGFGFPDEEAQRHPRAPPPCSRRALDQLTRVSVAPADLVIDNNRICSVCLESHGLGQVVVRLPCAHLFHPNCIVPWLETSCVCPVCRYELPTDCGEYESDRIQRMRNRKPRFYDHELSRLTVSQLKSLGRKPPACLEKDVWIQHLIDSNAIDVIPSPPPVVLHLKELQHMSTSQLKQQMEDAGVFYDPKLVVEKSDLIAIFCGSGRLHVIMTTTADDENETSNEDAFEADADKFKESCSINTDQGPFVVDQDFVVVEEHYSTVTTSSACGFGTVTATRTQRGKSMIIETVHHDDDDEEAKTAAVAHLNEEELYYVVLQEVPYQQEEEGVDLAASVPSSPQDSSSDNDAVAASDIMTKKRKRSPGVSALSADDSPTSKLEQRFAKWSISRLRGYASELSVDVSHCLERRDIIEQLILASPTWSVDEWGTCEIRALACLMDLDPASFDSHGALVDAVQDSLTETRHASYVPGMKILHGRSVRQLQDTATEWRVDVSDCVEKTEVIQRLLRHHRRLK